jgi:hypothetical protein
MTVSEKKIGFIPDVTMGLLIPKSYDLVVTSERLIFVKKKSGENQSVVGRSQSTFEYDIEGFDALESRSGNLSIANTKVVNLRLETTAKRSSELGMLSLRLRFISQSGRAKEIEAIFNPSLDFVRSKVPNPDKSKMAEQFREVQTEYAKIVREILTQAIPVSVFQNAEWRI